MKLKTAADMYDVPLGTLRMMCTRGEVVSALVGKHRYVTPEAMDAVFRPGQKESIKLIAGGKKK
jgi:hypothetical protein